MLLITIQIQPGRSEERVRLEDFINTSPSKEYAYHNENREKLFRKIQGAIDRRLGPDAKLVEVFGTYGSPEVNLAFLIAGGVAAYTFIKDYPSLREGIKLLSSDVSGIVEKMVEYYMPKRDMTLFEGQLPQNNENKIILTQFVNDVEVGEKYPPEIGENISKVK